MSIFWGTLFLLKSLSGVADPAISSKALWERFVALHEGRPSAALMTLADAEALALEPGLLYVLESGRADSSELFLVEQYILEWLLNEPYESEKERLARRWISRAERIAGEPWKEAHLYGSHAQAERAEVRRLLAAFIWPDDLRVQQAFFKIVKVQLENQLRSPARVTRIMERWEKRSENTPFEAINQGVLPSVEVFDLIEFTYLLMRVQWEGAGEARIFVRLRAMVIGLSLGLRKSLGPSDAFAYGYRILRLAEKFLVSSDPLIAQQGAFLASFLIRQGFRVEAQFETSTSAPKRRAEDSVIYNETMIKAGIALLKFLERVDEGSRSTRAAVERFFARGRPLRLISSPTFILAAPEKIVGLVLRAESGKLLSRWRIRATQTLIRSLEDGVFKDAEAFTSAARRIAELQTPEAYHALERWTSSPERYIVRHIGAQTADDVVKKLKIYMQLLELQFRREDISPSSLASWNACIEAFQRKPSGGRDLN